MVEFVRVTVPALVIPPPFVPAVFLVTEEPDNETVPPANMPPASSEAEFRQIAESTMFVVALLDEAIPPPVTALLSLTVEPMTAISTLGETRIPPPPPSV